MELKDLKNVAINCETLDEARECCELADKLGWKWKSDNSFCSETYWDYYEEETCYDFCECYFSPKCRFTENNYTIKPASWFLENFKTKDNMEEKEAKKGTLAEMYACANDELKKVLESKFSKDELGIEVRLPNTWEEFSKENVTNNEYYIDYRDSEICIIPNCLNGLEKEKCLLPSKQSAEAHLALMQLEQLRDCYRQGWLPNWGDGSNKYTIYKECNSVVTERSIHVNHFLAFQTEKLCEKFYENFKDLIKTSRDLI